MSASGMARGSSMGSWGHGVLQNDHAKDLLSGETMRWGAAELKSLRAQAAILQQKNPGPYVSGM